MAAPSSADKLAAAPPLAAAAAPHPALAAFHPLVAAWFVEKFGTPTEPQLAGWPRIHAGEDVLIAAPTGSGKTLAAFFACLDALVRRGLRAPLPDRTAILYISPLKALSNDVQRNLEAPLAELSAYFARHGEAFPELRVAVRTGDTPAGEREKMAKRPPHILVTTPESLYILLTTARGRAALSRVSAVIVDEIHAVAADKRGAHLALSLERLDRLVRQGDATEDAGALFRGLPPSPAPATEAPRPAASGRGAMRIGLSATQRPIERVGRLLVGNRRPMPHIVDGGHRRALDVAIEITDDELGAVASNEQFGRVYDRIAELVAAHRSTIVFVNTRRLVERVAAALEQRLGEEHVVAHHGSMSRALRLSAEQRLKLGQVRCAVATASLELGIDVGAVDLVVQLGSPRSLATLLQRVGRSGHHRGGTPKGRLFALTRDQAVECAALVRGIRRGNLDELELRDGPLDILAQQIVAICAAEELSEAELAELVRGAAQYGDLSDERLEQVLHLVSEGASERRSGIAAHVHRDRVNGALRARKGARLAALLNGGAIPDNNNYQVVQWPEELRVGEIDEDFAIESSAGDIFQLGNQAWRIRRVEAGRVLVEDAQGLPPTIPFWLGEAPARTRELSHEVSELRRDLDARLAAGEPSEAIAAWLAAETSLSPSAAAGMVAYLGAGRAALGALPRQDLLIAERFFDEGGGMQLVLHAPLGGRINRAWGLALRKRFCRSFDFELQAAATDDGIVISLGQPHSFPLESVFQFLPSAQAEPVLIQALLDAPMFEIRWRWNATRSLAVLRRRGDKKVAPHLVKMRSADLLSVVFPQAQACLENIPGDREIPDHPLVFETIRDCLVEAMDSQGLTELMAKLERGEIEVLGRDTVEPSPLSHELINANPYAFLDDAPLEERRTRAVSLRRGLPAEVAESSAALDPAAIRAAVEEATPVVRDREELHDALLALWLVPPELGARLAVSAPRWLDELCAAGRATELAWPASSEPARDGEEPPAPHRAWVAAERLASALAVLPGAVLAPPIAVPAWSTPLEPEAAVVKILGGHLDHFGPMTASALAADLGLSLPAVHAALLALEADGAILRGAFTRAAGPARAGRTVEEAAREIAAAEPGAGEGSPGAGAAPEVEWCNRRILARIHRLTLTRLRAEIEPVSAAALMRFLVRWQRVARGTQLLGSGGLERVIEQLGGWETAAGAWEREVLPARLCGYDPAWLDQLCLTGQVVWCRLSPRRRDPEPDAIGPGADDGAGAVGEAPRARAAPSRSAPLALMPRRDAPWLRAAAAVAEVGERAAEHLSAAARAVVAELSRSGASFLADLVARTALPADEVEDALWELVAAGWASADGFSSLRVLVDRGRGQVRSLHDAPQAAAPTARRWQDAVKKARHRDRERPSHALRSLPTAGGRWWLLPPAQAGEMDAEQSARQLLHRYGVVFRDLVTREASLPPWREVLAALRRLEARGELRGGRFVAGFVGEQFALPEALDELRAARKPAAFPEAVRVSATDPLNLVGVLSPGPRVPAVIGNALLLLDGVAVASLEGGQLVMRAPLPPGASVDDELRYHPPAPRASGALAQAALPL
ncbi:MAG: DEAD/DEAH box helicase [Kofleriaceae bacterium]